MKNHLLTSALLLVSFYSFSQTGNPVLDNIKFQNADITTNDQVVIPLYEIDVDGLNLPIYLTYDNSGIKASELPSTVGLKWKLNAGGMIRRDVNHIPDEFKGKTGFVSEESTDTIYGWFHDIIIMENYDGEYYNDNPQNTNVPLGHNLYSYHDGSPDMYYFRVSNGDYIDFSYHKNVNDPNFPQFQLSVIDFGGNQKYKIEPDVDVISLRDCYECEDYKITSEAGIKYLLEKGPTNEIPVISGYGIGGPPSEYGFYGYNDYYISKMKSLKNNNEITFDYVTNSNYQHEILASINPPSYAHYWEGVLSRQTYTNEVSEINSPKEKIVFNYTNFQYIVIGDVFNDDSVNYSKTIKLIDEILIYDFNQNFVSGYKFEYESYQSASGKPFLKKIFQISNDQNSLKLFREFEYYDPTYIASTLSPRQDVFGYSNNGFSNGIFDVNGYRNLTPINYQYSPDDGVFGADRTPFFDTLEAGMLKSITTKFGGRTEYEYKMNSSGVDYYGGVLVKSIKQFDTNNALVTKKEFSYENPNGFGIPILYPSGHPNEDNWKELFRKQIVQSGGFYNISNSPYELIDTDRLDQSVPNNAQSFQKYGSFYNKVISINSFEGDSEIGSVVKYYQPNYNSLGRGKILNKVEYLDKLQRIVSSEIYQYDLLLNKEINTIKFDNNHSWYTGSGGGGTGCSTEDGPNVVEDPLYGTICVFGRRYKLIDHKIVSLNYVLKESNVINENPNEDTYREITTSYEYLNEGTNEVDYTKVKKVLKNKVNSSIVDQYKEYLYLSELNFNNTPLESLLEYSNPIIQAANWKHNASVDILQGANIYDFYSDGKLKFIKSLHTNNTGHFYNANTYIDPYFNSNGNLISLGNLIEEYKYDTEGKIRTRLLHQKTYNEYYLRSDDYNENYVTAILKYKTENLNFHSSNQDSFYHNSFEKDVVTNDVIINVNAFSGKSVFTGASLNLGNFSNDIVLTYWSFQNGVWSFNTQEYSSGNVILNIAGGVDFIDEVRAKPKKSVLQSFTFRPLLGVESQINELGFSAKKHFDNYNRVIYVTDRNNKIISETKYNTINNN